MERDLKAAQASGDIATILSLMAKSTALTPSDYINKTIGTLLYLYYTYSSYFHFKPRDLEDLVDGLLYISARQYQEKQEWEQAQRRARSK